MTTKISSSQFQTTAVINISGPRVTNIQITNSSYTVTGATTISTSGGYITLTGSNFTNTCNIIIGNTPATSVTFVNSSTLNSQIPALVAGSYIVYVVDSVTGKTAVKINGLTVA